MTLSAPPEPTLRVPLAHPGDPPSRRIARIAGIFMVLTFISIPALPLYDQVLNNTNFIVGSGGVESCLIAVGIVSLLAMVTLRQDLVGAAGTDNASPDAHLKHRGSTSRSCCAHVEGVRSGVCPAYQRPPSSRRNSSPRARMRSTTAGSAATVARQEPGAE